MAVIDTSMDMPKGCWGCEHMMALDPDTNVCRRTGTKFDDKLDLLTTRQKDCPLKSTDEIIKEFGNASSNYPEEDDYSQGIHYGLHVAEQIIEHILYGENTDEN